MKNFPLYPFFLSAYSALALLASNITEVRASVVFRPMLAALILCGVLIALTSLWLRDRHRAGLVTSLILLVFYTYGHAYELLRHTLILGVNLGRHSILFPLTFLVLVGGVVFVLRSVPDPRLANFPLNAALLAMFILPLLQIGKYTLNMQHQPISQTDASIPANYSFRLDAPENLPLPDIYYIIPDMYSRHDALLGDMGYDNTMFLDGLRELGFTVADCSRSNYAQTTLSLTSALNMNYLSALGINDEPALLATYNNNIVRAALELIGYRTIVLESGFRRDEMIETGIDLPPTLHSFSLTPFELLYLRTTLLRVLVDVRLPGVSKVMDVITFPYSDHAARQQQLLQALKIVPGLAGPKFIYVHIMVPHPPFIFKPDGSLVIDALYYREAMGLPSTAELFQIGYTNQVEFISRELLTALKVIIQDSLTPPVIILQGDHGIRAENRMEILNAYYLPRRDQPYSTITPVNSFRWLFNQYFNAELELLPDKSYYSEFPERFNLREVPEYNPDCIQP